MLKALSFSDHLSNKESVVYITVLQRAVILYWYMSLFISLSYWEGWQGAWNIRHSYVTNKDNKTGNARIKSQWEAFA